MIQRHPLLTRRRPGGPHHVRIAGHLWHARGRRRHVLAAQLGSASCSIGPPYLLPAFYSVLLGATQIKTNGRASVPGTLVAVILLATGIYGLTLAGAPQWVPDLFNGLALILAVSLAVRAGRRR